jgi:hypothetical protein
MNRLSFVLNDFTRVIWNSDHAKAVWRPRINQISAAFSKIELQ